MPGPGSSRMIRASWNGAVVAESEDTVVVEDNHGARRAQTVTIGDLGLAVHLEEGEEILTEISAKFTGRQLGTESGAAGLRPVHAWRDPAGDFQLTLAGPPVGRQGNGAHPWDGT